MRTTEKLSGTPHAPLLFVCYPGSRSPFASVDLRCQITHCGPRNGIEANLTGHHGRSSCTGKGHLTPRSNPRLHPLTLPLIFIFFPKGSNLAAHPCQYSLRLFSVNIRC